MPCCWICVQCTLASCAEGAHVTTCKLPLVHCNGMYLIQLRHCLICWSGAGPTWFPLPPAHSVQIQFQSGQQLDLADSADQATTAMSNANHTCLTHAHRPYRLTDLCNSLPVGSHRLLSKCQPAHCQQRTEASGIGQSMNSTGSRNKLR